MAIDKTFKEIEESIDALQVYYGEPIKLSSGLTIYQPTIQQVKDFGERRFWNIASLLCSNPTTHRVMLWDLGIDWNDVKDFDLFYTLTRGLTKEDTSLIFGDIDLDKFRATEDDDHNLILVYLPDPDIQLDTESYMELVSYLRIFFGIHPKAEKAVGKMTKEIIIFDEKNRARFREMEEKGSAWSQSTLFSLISSAVNNAGFKYGIKECLELTIFQFLDAVKRQSVIQSANSVMVGMYSGMVDIKKAKLDKELDWTRNLYEDS